MASGEWQEALECAEAGRALTREHLLALLACDTDDEVGRLFKAAYAVKKATVGCTVRLRGLIEFSNICRKNCYYCGVRAGNPDVTRYRMTLAEIEAAAAWAFEHAFGSVVLQSGECRDEGFISFVEQAVRRIKALSGGRLGITLSTGEQSEETYRRWFEAGAHRYLLRIEASNPRLYGLLHPADHDPAVRVACLRSLRKTGYQVGTGVMIGLPQQTLADLVDDVLFFKAMDVDMIGMGPYIRHGGTPLGAASEGFDARRNLMLGLKMIAVTRLVLRDVNMAAATALQALDPGGRELGLMAGANVIMPNMTGAPYRDAYRLYENKPTCEETREDVLRNLQERIESMGETIGFDEWGDSPHFMRRRDLAHVHRSRP